MKVHYKSGLPLLFILVISKCCTHASLTSKVSSVDYNYKDDYDDDDDDYYGEDTKTIEAQTEVNRLIPNSIGEEIIATSKAALQSIIDIPKRSNHVLELTCPRACICLKDYTYIKCSNSNLKVIPANIPQTAIHIDLSQNQLSRLETADFSNYTKVVDINLSENQLTEIPKNVFAKNTKLQRLNLAGNRLTSIDPDTFSGISDLSALDLSNNSIRLPEKGSFLNQPRLLELSCRNCSWTQLFDETFNNLSSLTALRLDKNDFNKKINTNAFVPLRSLIKLRLPELEQQSVTELCNLLKSIDNISFSHFGVSCFELVLGTSFNESLITATDPPFQPAIIIATNSAGIHDNVDRSSATNMTYINITEDNILSTWTDMPAFATNIALNETRSTLATAGVIGSTSSTAKKGTDDTSYQVPVSQEAINIMLICIMIVALIGIGIGIICRKDVGGIKTKCCRTNKEQPKDDTHPAEEIPLNKLA